jgi:hypothetical protein
MSSNTATNTPKETTSEITSHEQSTSSVPHANVPNVPLNVDQVSTMFPDQDLPLAPVVKKEKSKGSKSATKGLDDKNDVGDNVDSVVDTGLAGETIVGETVDILGEKLNVGPDVETSLGQQEIQAEKAADIVEPNPEVRTAEGNENNSSNTSVNPPTNEDITATKSQEVVVASDEEETIGKDDNVVDLDEENSDLNKTIANTYKSNSIAKRLRSSTGKIVTHVTKTPNTRKKSTVVGPKK